MVSNKFLYPLNESASFSFLCVVGGWGEHWAPPQASVCISYIYLHINSFFVCHTLTLLVLSYFANDLKTFFISVYDNFCENNKLLHHETYF